GQKAPSIHFALDLLKVWMGQSERLMRVMTHIYRLVMAASELIMALATTALAATCAGSNEACMRYSPVASQPFNFSLSALNFCNSFSRNLKRISISFARGLRPVNCRYTLSTAGVNSDDRAICSPNTLAASTKVGSFETVRAWSGVLVSCRCTSLSLRSGASNTAITGWCTERFQAV